MEDSALAAVALKVLFEESGFTVRVAASAAEAIQLAAEERPDAALLDFGLPDADGLTVLEAWRRDDSTPRIVYALTGTDDPTVTEAARAAGCRDVIVKPARPLELLRTIRQAVG